MQVSAGGEIMQQLLRIGPKPMEKQYLNRSVSEVPCFCFGLACHGEPEIQKSIDNQL